MARKKTNEKEDRKPVAKPPTRTGTFRLNEDDVSVLDRLRIRTGIQSLTCIIRLAIREACETRGIDHVILVESARFSRQVDANYGKEEKLCPDRPSRVEARRRSRRQRASKRASSTRRGSCAW